MKGGTLLTKTFESLSGNSELETSDLEVPPPEHVASVGLIAGIPDMRSLYISFSISALSEMLRVWNLLGLWQLYRVFTPTDRYTVQPHHHTERDFPDFENVMED